MTQPLESVLELVKFFGLEYDFLDVELADVRIGVYALEVNLLEESHVVIRVIYLVAEWKVRWVYDVTPEAPDHDGVAGASLLPAFHKGP